MRRWWLSVAVILGGSVGLASAEYLVIIANVGEMHAPEKTTKPGIPGGPNVPGVPGGPKPGGPLSGPMPGVRGTPGEATPPVDTKAIEEKIIVAILPLEHSLNQTQKSNLTTKKAFSVPYQTKYHAHVVSLDFVVDHPDETRVGVTLHRVVDARNPTGLSMDTPPHRFIARRNHLFNTENKPSADKLFDLLDFALGHGLNKDVGIVIEDLEKLDKDHALVKAYRKLQEDLSRELPDDPLESQRVGLTKDRKSVKSPHFTLWYTPKTTGEAQAQTRLDRLEDALQTYYLWWALSASHHTGMPLPLPTSRLTVFLDGDEKEFKELHGQLSFRRDPGAFKGEPHEQTAFTTAPLVSGGYYSRRENLTVLSFKRLDPKYDLLNNYCGGIWDEVGQPEKVLTSRKELTPGKEASQSKAQSFAMMVKIMENDAERASVSHNVSRQLVVASGLLPGGLAAPEWVEFGLGSFFETPLNAPWASPTDASSLYWPAFEELQANRSKAKTSPFEKLEKNPGDTLKMVIKDGYFREIPADKGDLPALLTKARTTSWALMYFLAREEPVKLRAYLAELSRLPRDMELTDEVLERCFFRAFQMWDESNQRVNDADAANFESRWFRVVGAANPDFQELLATVKKARETMVKASTTGPTTPGQPGQPMLPPGMRRP